LFDDLIADKFAVSQIVELLREQAHSVGEIADRLGMTRSEVSKHLSSSTRQRIVRFDDDQMRYVIA
jgi:F420-non-reducing hydrogenase iron-sulfur subunit